LPPTLAPTAPEPGDAAAAAASTPGTPGPAGGPAATGAAAKPAAPKPVGAAPPSADVIPQSLPVAPAAAAPAAPPALATQLGDAIMSAAAEGLVSPTGEAAGLDGRPRDTAAPSDASGTTGLAIPAQPTNGAAAAGVATPASGSRPNDAATAPVPIAEVAVTLAAQAQSGKNRFEIRLDPPELGRIDVQLNVDGSGSVSSRLVVERPDTLNLLIRDAPQLQRALQDAGLNTAGGMQFSLADQGFANRNAFAQQNDFASPPTARSSTGDPVPLAALQGYGAWSGRSGGLDITV
jgi:flagellar hook-length control protein FliK